MQPTVSIKGIREGLLISVGDGEWGLVQVELLNQIEKKADFLQGAKIILDVENHILNASSLGKLRDLLGDRGVSLWAVLSHSPTTEQAAQMLGMATKIHQSHPSVEKQSHDIELDGDEGIVVQRTLRSGSKVSFDGHITIIGDVNPGAEIIAGGSVFVWGRLRGMVQAGVDGDKAVVVCALELSPTQLRIANKIALTPDDKDKVGPEIAYIRDDTVVAEPWSSSRK